MQRKKQIGILILFCLFCAVFLVSGYMLISNMAKHKAAADAYQEIQIGIQDYKDTSVIWDNPAEATGSVVPRPLPDSPTEQLKPLITMDFSSLQEINPEIIGWIRGEGTGIDYPVMQTDNNSYYLTHLYNGEYNNNGSIFMDYRNNGDLSDKNTVLYGHHMRNDVLMFGSLKEYNDQEFYEANPTMAIYTPDGDYMIELISGTVENGDYEFIRFHFESDEAFLNYVEELRSRSTFTSGVEVQAEDQIISLCTCSYERNNARYMVVGRLVPLYQPQQAVTQDTMQKDLL